MLIRVTKSLFHSIQNFIVPQGEVSLAARATRRRAAVGIKGETRSLLVLLTGKTMATGQQVRLTVKSMVETINIKEPSSAHA